MLHLIFHCILVSLYREITTDIIRHNGIMLNAMERNPSEWKKDVSWHWNFKCSTCQAPIVWTHAYLDGILIDRFTWADHQLVTSRLGITVQRYRSMAIPIEIDV